MLRTFVGAIGGIYARIYLYTYIYSMYIYIHISMHLYMYAYIATGLCDVKALAAVCAEAPQELCAQASTASAQLLN